MEADEQFLPSRKTGKAVGAELGLEPRVSHGAACHNKKRELAATYFSEIIYYIFCN